MVRQVPRSLLPGQAGTGLAFDSWSWDKTEPDPDPDVLYDPATSLDLGAEYLATQLRRQHHRGSG